MSERSADLKLRNLTAHCITLRTRSGEVVIPPDPVGPARIDLVSEEAETVCTVAASGEPVGLRLVRVTPHPAPGDLPDAREDTLLLVSRTVADAYPQRSDLVVPVELERDADGRVVSAGALALGSCERDRP